jgi:CheY-like chemotaxis protein/anti-sigma regulatory factor (Ser/Thr protein kinase)
VARLDDGKVVNPSPGVGARARVLVVDDERVNRLVLGHILREQFEVVEAEDGIQALSRLDGVDLVLLDIHMPGMDGYEATRAIKGLRTRFLPVVLMTADNDEVRLAAGLEAGADDFVTKPVSRTILLSKLDALLRVSELMRQLRDRNVELAYFRDKAQREFEVAKRVFDGIADRSAFGRCAVKPHTQPLETLNGDLLMAAPVSSSRLRLFIGDFTGHGLPAALGALPVSETFYTMTARDLPIDAVVRELNAKLHRLLPRSLFLSACMIDVDAAAGRISYWNGGIPAPLLLDSDRRVRARLDSRHLPLGILPSPELQAQTITIDVCPGDELFLFTDGLVETPNPQGDLYGHERLEALLARSRPGPDFAPALLEDLQRFQAGAPALDDVTFLLLPTGRALLEAFAGTGTRSIDGPPSERLFGFDLRFGHEELREADPLGLSVSLLERSPLLAPDAAVLFTVLSELFSNAVEHGLLRLDSRMKEGAEGFAAFYRERARRLESLEDGWVRLALQVMSTADGREAWIRVEDSGPGFDPAELRADPRTSTAPSGRGLSMLRALCSAVRFLDSGRTVEVVVPLAAPAAGARAHRA